MSDEKDEKKKKKQKERDMRMDLALGHDRIDEEADGKRELDYGSEDLEKPMSKSLFQRWEAIKKNLDNQSAILDLSTFSEDEDDDDGEDEQSAHPEWLPEDVPHDDQQ